MADTPLKLRPDIVVSRQSSKDATWFVVKDPLRSRYFRLGPVEYALVSRLDGRRSLERIAEEIGAETDLDVPLADLERFVAKLRHLGLVEEVTPQGGLLAGDRPNGSGAGADAPTRGAAAETIVPPESGAPMGQLTRGPWPHEAPRQGRFLRGSILYLRLPAFDPSWILDALAGRTAFLFTRAFLIISASLIGCAFLITVLDRVQIAEGVLRLYHLRTLVLAWITVYLVIVAHEFAHGLTCRHFGGRVREMGFLLIYFQPAFYCNVSDAWMFPRKSSRLWVTFAGAYFEIFLWALAVLVWRLVEPGTVVSDLALVVMATSVVKTLINLNPLIKLDGYYLLSDWLEIPNLRWKAFAYMKSLPGRLLGARGALVRPSPRERRIFLLYGVLAGVYSFWLLALVTKYVGGSLVRSYQGWGFLVFAMLLGFVFRGPLRRGAGGVARALGIGGAMSRRVLRLAVLAVIAVPLALFVLFGRLELKVSGEFHILPETNADVRAEVDGILQEIYVDEGSEVHEGETIALLSDRDYRTEASKVRAQIEEKRAVLRMLQAGPRPEEVQLARTSLDKARERERFAREQLERIEPLFEEKLLSRKELEEAREEVAIRQKELEEAQGRLDLLLAGTRPEEIEAAEAEISRLETEQRFIATQLRSIKVPSPIDGVVTSRELKERIGEAVKRGDLIAKVHALDTVEAEIAVPEQEIADVAVGQRVVLRARAQPGATFEGRVVAIAPTVTQPEDDRTERTIVVTTHLENPRHLLKSEMTGNAKIYCGERRVLDLVTRRIQRYIRVEFWSWW